MLTELRKQIFEARQNGEDTSYLEQLLEQAKEAYAIAEFDDLAAQNSTDEELAYL